MKFHFEIFRNGQNLISIIQFQNIGTVFNDFSEINKFLEFFTDHFVEIEKR